jgi:hypothetical protein
MIATSAHRLMEKIMRKSTGVTPKDGNRFWEKITLKRKSMIPVARRSEKKA